MTETREGPKTSNCKPLVLDKKANNPSRPVSVRFTDVFIKKESLVINLIPVISLTRQNISFIVTSTTLREKGATFFNDTVRAGLPFKSFKAFKEARLFGLKI